MSIEAKDLRTGNRFIRELRNERGLEYDHDFVLCENLMGKLFSQNISIALQDLFPIPLTTEILIKAGFVNIGERKGEIDPITKEPIEKDWIIFAIGIAYTEEGAYTADMELELEDDGETWLVNIHSVYIKYLHQLQNLYFALTGKELEIQL